MKLLKHLKHTFIPHRHNNYQPHAIKLGGLSIIAVIVLGLNLSYNVQSSDNFQVLGYSTNVSIGDLHSLTNSERSARGLSTYSLNSKLNSAAQAKANHMIANNYWAHTSPGGVTPWYFIGNAGYSYVKAGENLAYGFATSSGVVNGWMNSPSHKANVLDNNFRDVGFGIANGANFQGGENTVVVAMYGQPTAATPTPAPVAAASAPTPSSSTPAQKKEPKKEEVKEETEPEFVENEVGSQIFLAQLDAEQINVMGPAVTSVAGDTITNLEAVLTGQAHWSLYATMGALTALAVVYFFRHMTAIIQVVRHGEHFVVGHPLLEAGIIYAALWLLMAGTYGVIL